MDTSGEHEARAVHALIGRLEATYPDVPAGVVGDIVNASLAEFTGVPIRDFVPVLVERTARDRLRHNGSHQ